MINKSIKQNNSSTFFILAGEQSADNYGAILIRSLKKIKPNAKFTGIGGKNMKEAGLNSIENINKLSVMGFVEIIKHLFFFVALTDRVLKEIKLVKPLQIILIDYPGFNLRLAKKIKARFNIPITYYISPKLWAWKENRIEIIRECIDQMLVIFPFEESWYKERGIHVKFVGHPVFDDWAPTPRRNLCNSLGLNLNMPIITLFPGSRKQELNQHLLLFIRVAEKLRYKNPKLQFILGLAHEMNLDSFSIPDWINIEKDYPLKALECADVALVSSGTATLEAAVFGTPMIIIYKMDLLTWWLAKLFVKTDYAGIVNIIAEKKIIPEYLQNQATAQSIAKEAFEMINNSDRLKNMRSKLRSVRQKLQGSGASQKAAQHILSLTQSK